MNSQPITAIEVQVTMTTQTIAEIILAGLILILIYFILKSRFA